MGEVTESDELRQLCQQKPHPDLLLFSPNLDGSSVVEILDYVGKHCPSIKILVMLSHTEETNSKQLIDHGVRGIILKNEPPEKLLEAICAIVQGQLWFSALLMPILLKAQLSIPKNDLTKRELDALQLLAEGKTNREIAQVLNIAERTVRCHLESIYIKLGAKSRVEAVMQATRLKLIVE
jgi:DNA-binding NarL/FixJ family response regulator